MLQIDHVYEFFFTNMFSKTLMYHCPRGVVKQGPITINDILIFTHSQLTTVKMFFYDQEPVLESFANNYLDAFNFPEPWTVDEIVEFNSQNHLPFNYDIMEDYAIDFIRDHQHFFYRKKIIVTSEQSELVNSYSKKYNATMLYYFFHGYAALDWYRGFYALNYNKPVTKEYKYDYITFNRLISNDRSYRCYFVSQLVEHGLLDQGQISFGLDNEHGTWRDEVASDDTKLSANAIEHINKYLPFNSLIIDSECVAGSASADIPRCANDSFWHIVTETVFYYDKLHLTEKIFKPIVMKQPFMLLAAPGNLAYLKRYGFKTFDGIIDESYDTIQDPDLRVEAVVKQIAWYCALTAEEKRSVIEAIAPIVEYNFQHFYGEFKHTITRELLDNTQTALKEVGYNSGDIDYDAIFKVLTN